MNKKKMIVISYDAFSEDDWEMASGLPNLKRMIENGSYTTNLESVYPSLTYVVHTTMVTGVAPSFHGIYHNNPLQAFVAEKEREWFWYRKQIKAPTIYDVARKQQYRTAAILWPVTGKSSIHYNLPEICAIGKENQILKILQTGSKKYCLEMQLRNGHLRKGIMQPYLDEFATKCAIDTILKKRADLIFLHLTDLDDAKHRYGVQSEQANAAIRRMDQRIGNIMRAVECAKEEAETSIMIVGDHGQMDVHYQIRLNNLFCKEHLIYEKEGKSQWRAYVQSGGGSAYLYIKEGDLEAEHKALSVIEKMKQQAAYGIQDVYNKDQMLSKGIDAPACYMLEARPGSYFSDEVEDPSVLDLKKNGIVHATHGYLPDQKGYHCNLILSGPAIRKNYVMGKKKMVDIAPTIAGILQMDFPKAQGKCMNEIFNPGFWKV